MVGIVVGLAGVVLAAALPFAPVVVESTTLSWPKGGDPATTVQPSTAFLVPYRPAELHVAVPCRIVRSALERRDRTTVLATTTSADSQGLVVVTERDELHVLVNGRLVPVALPVGDCTLRVDAGPDGVSVAPGGQAPVRLRTDPVPQVFAIDTDMTGEAGAGMTVSARTPRWFDSTPSTSKTAMVNGQVWLVGVSLVVLTLLGLTRSRQDQPCRDRTGSARTGHGPIGPARTGNVMAIPAMAIPAMAIPAGVEPTEAIPTGAGRADAIRYAIRHAIGYTALWVGRFARRGRDGVATAAASTRRRAGATFHTAAAAVTRVSSYGMLAVDVGVIATLAVWRVVGPGTDDDGFATMIARGALGTGHVNNYYRWFNASEAPFTLGQQVVEYMARTDLAPVWLRLPSVLAGAGVWLLVTRGLLRPGLPGLARSVPVRATAAVCFLGWWLPYNLGTRPEPLVALGATAVFVLVLRAVSVNARHRLLLLGGAALAAGLTVPLAPSATLTAVPVLVCLPRLWRVLTTGCPHAGAAPRRWLSAVTHLLLLAAVAAVGATIAFADQSWHGVVVSTAIHQQIGPNDPWFAEWLRYQNLLGDDNWGSATKRLPVLLTISLVPAGLVLLARRTRRLLGGGEAVSFLLSAPVALGLLAANPSKWSQHFGAVAGFGTVFLTALAAGALETARQHPTDPVTRAAGGASAVLAALAATVSFTGPNSWWGYFDFGVPWADSPVMPLAHPLCWLGAGAAASLAVGVGLRARVIRAKPGDSRRDPASPTAGPTAETTRGPAATRSAALSAALSASPAVLTVLAAGASVAVLLYSFLPIPAQRAATYSVGGENTAGAPILSAAAHPRGRLDCGVEDHVQVLADAGKGALAAAEGTDRLEGFTATGGSPTPPPIQPARDVGTLTADRVNATSRQNTSRQNTSGQNTGGQTTVTTDPVNTNDAPRFVWGSQTDGDVSTGSMTSRWFTLPPPGPGQEIAVSVAGRTDQGDSVALEFARSARRSSPTPLGERALADPPSPDRHGRGYAADPTQQQAQDRTRDLSTWRTLTVPAAAIPAGADRVRVQASDGRTDDQGWVAVTGPRMVDVIPLAQYLTDRAPVYVDWSVAFSLPCVRDVPQVAGGLAQAPRVLLAPPNPPTDPLPGDRTPDSSAPADIVPDRWTNALGLGTGTDSAGSFAGIYQVGKVSEIDTRLDGDPGRSWGRVFVIDTKPLHHDRYDTHTNLTEIPGNAGDPPPPNDPQAGITYPTTTTASPP